MPPTVKENGILTTRPETAQLPAPNNTSPSDAAIKQQAVTLEVPVTVNGARAVEGRDKREPFSETTSTVLVLATGAVIRLSSSVAPGQLLFLTNEKTRKEVVCQVVKSKNYRSAGYVELEFTEPVLGFWGMRFPGERQTAQANAPVADRQKFDSAPLSAEFPATNAETKPPSLVDARPIVENVTPNLADEVQEFKAEIKADSRPTSKADFLAPAEPSIDGLKLDANRLQEQLSSLLSADRKQSEGAPAASVVPPSRQELGDAAAKIFDMATEESAAAKMETAPVKSDASLLAHTPKSAKSATSSFDDEEVKIPAWLEPLARNAAIPAPAPEKGASDSGAEFEERQAPEAVEPAPAPKHVAATAKKTARATRYTKAAPLFGNSLLGESKPEVTSPRRRGKGIWMGIAAGLIVAAASGAWYFRHSLASLAPARAASESNTSPASSERPASLETAPPANSAALATPSLRPNAAPDASSPVKKENSASAMTEAPATVSSPAEGKVQAAAITERVPKSGSNNDIFNEPAKSAEPVEPEITRPSLGKIRLAKPKVRRSASVQANGEMEPALEVNSDELASGENTLGANLAEGAKQPAAPAAPTGGDVKPARLISSVPPSYPALARTQHIAGEVRVDALIDTTGRVTTMKVVSGPSLLHQAAMDALRQWKYQAATLDGKPVPMRLTVTIQFRLQ